MTEFRYEKDKAAIKDYLKTVTFKGNAANKVLIIALAVCLLVVAIAGIVYCVMTGSIGMIAITVAAILIAAVYPIVLTVTINHVAEKLSKSSSEDEKDITIAVSENNILLLKKGSPCGKIEWSEITDIHEGKAGFYLTIKEEEVLILSEASVTSGTYDEAAQVIRIKKAIMPKEEK